MDGILRGFFYGLQDTAFRPVMAFLIQPSKGLFPLSTMQRKRENTDDGYQKHSISRYDDSLDEPVAEFRLLTGDQSQA